LRIKKGNPRIEVIGPGFFLFWGGIMHLYWRIREELLYLGEVLVFLDPRFVREFRRWVKRRFASDKCRVIRLEKGDGK